MRPEAQMKILNLCKGKTIAQATNRLEIAQNFVALKQLNLRTKIVGLTIGA